MEIKKAGVVENFIGKYFMLMPKWVRVIVYLLIVLAFIHNYLKPAVLQGQLWITNQSGANEAGEEYEIRHGTSAFRVNSDGRWALTTARKLPGTINVTIVDAKNRCIGDVGLSMPLPVWSAIIPKQYSITYEGKGAFSVKETARIGSGILAVAYAQPEVPALGPNLVTERWYVKINSLNVKESGDSKGHTGELYFKVSLNGKKLEQTGLPNKRYSNTHLLIDDNTTTVFKNLGFFLPESVQNAPELELQIKIYDHDLFGGDDKVGDFKVILNSNTEFGEPNTYITKKLNRNWPDNSSITIEFKKKEY